MRICQSLKYINVKIKQNYNMSIYSGFATRNLQQTYDQYLCDLLFVLQKRILKFYQNVQADQQKFYQIFSQLYHHIVHLQKSKYLQPKSSIYVSQMFQYLKLKKQQRNQDPQQDLKQFQRSLAIKINQQKSNQLKQLQQTQINHVIRRSSYSFGKIKRQLDHNKIINISSQNTHNKDNSINNSFDLKLQTKLNNPQQKSSIKKQKRIFSSKGIRNTKSFHQQISQNKNQIKININGGNGAEQVVKKYLQKTNKNYLRGYRKRKIKQEFNNSQAITPLTKHFIKDRSSGR